MKPPLFHVGQAAVCVKNVDVNYTDCPPVARVGLVYEVESLHEFSGGWYIKCAEWSSAVAISEKAFAPVELLPAEAYAELLEALEPVTADII